MRDFAERTQIPVTTTLMGIGGISRKHPLWLGMPGMHGTYAANHALLECDLLIGIGARFDDRVTMGRLDKFATRRQIVHIDIDPAEIGKNVDTYIPIVGDVKKSFICLAGWSSPLPVARRWVKQVQSWCREKPDDLRDSDQVLKPQWVIRHLYESTGGDAIVTPMSVNTRCGWPNIFRFAKPRSFITSGGLGAMGFGSPPPWVPRLARTRGPRDQCYRRRGGVQMTSQELAVDRPEQHPCQSGGDRITGAWGWFDEWQEVFYKKRYSRRWIWPTAPILSELAEAYM